MKTPTERNTPSLANVREAVAQALEGFIHDPPDTEFQRGYLAALITLAKDDLGEDVYSYPYAEAIGTLAASGLGTSLDVGVSV
jgi:hypothetical protein